MEVSRVSKAYLDWLLLLAFATPALAATEFYIVRGQDKKCEVVEQKPTTTTTVIMGTRPTPQEKRLSRSSQLFATTSRRLM